MIINNIRYASGTVIMAESGTKMLSIRTVRASSTNGCLKMCLEINPAKTKTVVFSGGPREKTAHFSMRGVIYNMHSAIYDLVEK